MAHSSLASLHSNVISSSEMSKSATSRSQKPPQAPSLGPWLFPLFLMQIKQTLRFHHSCKSHLAHLIFPQLSINSFFRHFSHWPEIKKFYLLQLHKIISIMHRFYLTCYKSNRSSSNLIKQNSKQNIGLCNIFFIKSSI